MKEDQEIVTSPELAMEAFRRAVFKVHEAERLRQKFLDILHAEAIAEGRSPDDVPNFKIVFLNSPKSML